MQAHGSFELAVSNRTLIIKAIGAWNYETMLQFGSEYIQLVEQFQSDTWACLIDLEEWDLATPDIWEYADQLGELSNDSKLKYQAVICASNIQQILVAKNQQALTNVETKFCDDLPQARAWLKSVGVL